jgi:LysM repeat protein
MMDRVHRSVVVVGVALAFVLTGCSLTESSAPAPTATLSVAFAPTTLPTLVLAVPTSTEPPVVVAPTGQQPLLITATPGSAPTIAVVVPVATITPDTGAAGSSGVAVNSGVTGTCVQPLGWVVYTVQPGDTISLLAERTGTTMQELIAANCLANADVINAGQTIYLPSAPAAAAPTAIVTAVVSAKTGPSVGMVWVEPALIRDNGQFYVASGTTVTVRARDVVNSTKVTFMLQPIGTNTAPTILGVDTNLSDGVAIPWIVNEPNLRANLWAIATNAANETTQTTPIIVIATASTNP